MHLLFREILCKYCAGSIAKVMLITYLFVSTALFVFAPILVDWSSQGLANRLCRWLPFLAVFVARFWAFVAHVPHKRKSTCSKSSYVGADVDADFKKHVAEKDCCQNIVSVNSSTKQANITSYYFVDVIEVKDNVLVWMIVLTFIQNLVLIIYVHFWEPYFFVINISLN